MKRQLLGAVAALAIFAGFTVAAEAKTLVYCSEGSPENFNPQINTTGTSFDAAYPVYNRLVEFKPGTTEIMPALADKWDVSDDGLTYTFHLHKGVKFHSVKGFTPTRDFNADDVVATFNRPWKADDPYHNVSGGAYDYFNDMGMADLLKSIDKVDDYTVKFTLNEPNAPFIANLAMDFAAILSKEYMDAMMKAGTPEQVDQVPVGTGPFIFVDYQKDAVIRYKANPDYFRGKQKIDNLVFAITPDATARMAKLQAGECQIAPYPNPADIEKLKADPNLKVEQQEGLNVGYVSMNVTKKPFDDVRVRQAMNMAIDKDAIIKAVFQGAGKPAVNPIPPTIWSYDKDIKPYPYDPAKAKALLAEAGYANGFTTDLWYMPVQRPYNPDAKKIAELIQADLAKLGITAELKSYEWGEYRKRLQAGEHQMGQLGWTGDNGDPDNFMGVLLSCQSAREGGQNLSKWCNKDFSALIDEAKKTSDVAKRTELYEKAQVIFHDDAPWIPIAHSVVYMPMSKKVVGYKVHPLGTHIFEGVDIQE
ncbi:MAG TPA: ABC transporter substrate-binding protein [Hypericibacter adhaerens]|uniref:ABC transporter substrate-binding protein n=1 Tax=Hypericibacter adhaerens TaxID=2602016 RepID=A0A5J6MVQ0_9PROT|nr:ABC transporter substrate-binding protein [Hypericibacter adhaerens]QEX21203.1 ABC transporter substrate-binding protein [Hypericibacter adhaerens]HWA43424.1 ABC transporter substrate-binding protein [Hypericibacter adhaerens]